MPSFAFFATLSAPPGSDNIAQYLPLFTMLVLGILFVIGSMVASKLLAPQRPTRPKLAPYECGIVPTRQPPVRFPVRFYLVALTFVVLDVEVIFLFPYAVNASGFGLYGLIAMLVFTVPVLVTLAYELSTGSLDWGPINKLRSVAPANQAKSSVRRVARVDTPSLAQTQEA
jgi:NADH-quinone oxidoreductase subunit A